MNEVEDITIDDFKVYDKTYILMEDRTETLFYPASYPPITAPEIAKTLKKLGYNPEDYLWADVHDGGWVSHVVAWDENVRRTVRRVDIFDDIPDESYQVMDHYLNGMDAEFTHFGWHMEIKWIAKSAAMAIFSYGDPQGLTLEEWTKKLESEKDHIITFGEYWTRKIVGRPVVIYGEEESKC